MIFKYCRNLAIYGLPLAWFQKNNIGFKTWGIQFWLYMISASNLWKDSKKIGYHKALPMTLYTNYHTLTQLSSVSSTSSTLNFLDKHLIARWLYLLRKLHCSLWQGKYLFWSPIFHIFTFLTSQSLLPSCIWIHEQKWIPGIRVEVNNYP